MDNASFKRVRKITKSDY